MGIRTPPYKNYPAWSEARFWGFIRSALRSAWSKYPPKYTVLKDARRDYKGPKKSQKYEFQCNECKKWHVSSNVSVDHIVPAGSLKCYADLPGFVERLFVAKEDLQVLCKGCHNIKTAEERKNK